MPKSSQAPASNAARRRIRRELHTLYVTLLHVRSAKDALKRIGKQRPLSPGEHEELHLLHQDHQQLQQQLDQLVSELWQLTGEASDASLTVVPRVSADPAVLNERRKAPLNAPR